MYYTNCHQTNHNVKTCQIKKKNLTMTMAKVNAQATKTPRPLIYHIYGFIGHKLTTCPTFNKIQNMFKDKGSKIVKRNMLLT